MTAEAVPYGPCGTTALEQDDRVGANKAHEWVVVVVRVVVVVVVVVVAVVVV